VRDVNLLRHGKDQTNPSSVNYHIEVDQAAVVVGPTRTVVDATTHRPPRHCRPLTPTRT
jgi:hypothetical protein